MNELKKQLGGYIMKTIYFFVAISIVLSFTACSNSDDSVIDESSYFESVIDVYGLEVAPAGVTDVNDIPSVTLEDMCGVLDALHLNSNTQRNCIVKSSDAEYFESSNEVGRKVIMTGEYKATTRSGSVLEEFALCVELNFNMEDGQAYYLGTDYSYSSSLFNWRAKGLSLSPVKSASGYTYQFESQSYVYFKVKDQGNCIVRVPVLFKGTYDFRSEKGVYDFYLLKYN